MANNTKAAGRITGSPLCGLCERVCIEAKKISDGCIGRFGNVTFTVTLSDFTGGMTTPYTFERAVSSGSTTLENLTVTAIRGNRSRVAFDSFIPIIVYYTDAAGVTGTAKGTVTFSRDVVLTVPSDSVVPYSIEATTAISSNIGAFSSDYASVTIICCIIQIVRVVTTVEILVPSYGYCEYPACENYADEVCEGVFARPIFPSTT